MTFCKKKKSIRCDDFLLTIISSLLARSSNIFWKGVLVASCSTIFSWFFLCRFRFSITLSNSLLVFSTLTPLKNKKEKFLAIFFLVLSVSQLLVKVSKFYGFKIVLMLNASRPEIPFPLDCTTMRVQPKMIVLYRCWNVQLLTKVLWIWNRRKVFFNTWLRNFATLFVCKNALQMHLFFHQSI